MRYGVKLETASNGRPIKGLFGWTPERVLAGGILYRIPRAAVEHGGFAELSLHTRGNGPLTSQSPRKSCSQEGCTASDFDRKRTSLFNVSPYRRLCLPLAAQILGM